MNSGLLAQHTPRLPLLPLHLAASLLEVPVPMMQEEQVHVPKIVTQTRRWPGFKRCQVGFRGPFLQFRSLGGARLYTPIMENQMEKNMENDMDTGTI